LHDLLNHPAVQAGLVPFIAALVTAELLQRLRLSGLAIIAAFAATVYLTSDFGMVPFTGVRKIVWLGLGSSALAIVLTLFNSSLWRPALAALAAATAVWVGLRILQQHPITEALEWGVACALYVGWLVYWFDGLRDDPVAAGSAGFALGFGTGGAALLGSSALLGQFGLALGAACSAYLLIQAISNSRLPCGRSFTLTLSLLAGLIGCQGVLSAQLPWYALAPLGLIPLVAMIPLAQVRAVWLQSLLLTVATSICAAGAVYLTWRVEGSVPF